VLAVDSWQLAAVPRHLICQLPTVNG